MALRRNRVRLCNHEADFYQQLSIVVGRMPDSFLDCPLLAVRKSWIFLVHADLPKPGKKHCSDTKTLKELEGRHISEFSGEIRRLIANPFQTSCYFRLVNVDGQCGSSQVTRSSL